MRTLIILLLSIAPYALFSQNGIQGYVRNSKTNEGIVGANVIVGNVGTATNSSGLLTIGRLKAGEFSLEVSDLGYEKYQQKILVVERNRLELEIKLVENRIQLDEIVVSATRSENRISEIPGRISLITPERLSFTASQTTDEVLALLPGVQVSRSFGLFSHKSSVTMRGLSGNEQARTLVLIDGIPVNKADGGSVNWNLISTGDVERIEVVKGPGSALYGGNAMGGVINVINRRPSKSLEGFVNIDYGTYNTQGVKTRIAGRLGRSSSKYFYWSDRKSVV